MSQSVLYTDAIPDVFSYILKRPLKSQYYKPEFDIPEKLLE